MSVKPTFNVKIIHSSTSKKAMLTKPITVTLKGQKSI